MKEYTKLHRKPYALIEGEKVVCRICKKPLSFSSIGSYSRCDNPKCKGKRVYTEEIRHADGSSVERTVIKKEYGKSWV